MIQGYNIVEKNGKPAKSRFSDPIALRAVYDQLTLDDAKDAQRRAKIKSMDEGRLPYDPATLEKCGIKNVTNVNWLGLKGVIDNRADIMLRLSCDTTNLISLMPLARELAGPDADRIARVVSEEFSTTVREVDKIIPALATMQRESDLYGIGPITWTSSLDYNPVALERAQIRFVSDGPANSSDHELFMFETTLPASYMFSLLDNPGIAAKAGWDVESVKEWLVKVFRDNIDTRATPGIDGTSAIETSISLIRQNRFEEEHQFQRLHVIHAFVKEMAIPRGITHIIMPSVEHDKFLFVKPNAYRCMDDCFIWFPYSGSERYAKSIRGIASYLYPIELVNNRYKCRVMDLAFQNASFMLTQSALGSQQSLTLNEQGPYTIIPKELEPVQSNVRPDMKAVMAFSQFVDNIGVNSVTGNNLSELSQTGPQLFEGQKQPTKFEAELQQHLRSRKEEALFAKRMAVLDKVFRQSFTRFIALAISGDPVLLADYPEIVTFLDRCARRGVTPEMLAQIPSMFTVVTCRDLVLGADGKVGALSELLSNFGSLADEPGRKSMFRDMVQLRLGAQSADRYAAERTRDSAPSDQASFATVENNMMKQGLQAMVGQDQLHWSHIPVHAQVLQEIVEMVRAPRDNSPEADTFGNPTADVSIAENTLQATNNDPRRTLLVLQLASTHVQEHLAIGGQQIGMKDKAAEVTKMIRDLRPTIKALNLAVATQEKVEQAQREQAQRDEEARIDQLAAEKAQVAQIEADKKAETDRYRVDREHEVAMHKLELEAGRASTQAELDNRRFEGDEARRNAESQSRIDMQAKLADAKVNAANAAARFDVTNEVTGHPGVEPADIINNGTPYGSL